MLKSSSKSSRFDFKTKKWNGEKRTAFNFSRFIHLEVKKAGRGYILEPARYPTPAVPTLSRRLIADDQTARETEVEANRIANEGAVTAAQHTVDAANQAATNLWFNFHQAAQVLNPAHAWPPAPIPIIFDPTTVAHIPLNFPPELARTCDHRAEETFSKNSRKFDDDSQWIMAFISEHCGRDITTKLDRITANHQLPRRQALQFIELIAQYLEDTASIRLLVENDMKNLPQATTMESLISIISDLQDLNSDLELMGGAHVKTDTDLIQILLSKMKAKHFEP